MGETTVKFFFVISFFCSISVLFITEAAKGGEGIIISYEAPLFKDPKLNSLLVQKLKKGEKIYIHDKHFKNNEDRENLEKKTDFYAFQNLKKPLPDLAKKDNETFSEEFFTTIDKTGRESFVPKRYVKLIYKDEREDLKKINPFIVDPTDSRIKAKLPEDYPFYAYDHRRAFVLMGTQVRPSSRYRYGDNRVASEHHQSYPIDVMGYYAHAAPFGEKNKIYWGGMFVFNRRDETFRFYKNSGPQLFSEEESISLGIGPSLTYDTIRLQDLDFQVSFLFSPLFYVFDQVNVSQHRIDGYYETKSFQGFSWGLRTGILLQKGGWIPDTETVLALITEINLPADLKSSTKPRIPSLWPSNSYKKSLEFSLGLSFGFQASI
jgi:hypothetical protein